MHQPGRLAFLTGAAGLVERKLIWLLSMQDFLCSIHYMDLRYLLMWKAILIMPKLPESVSLSPKSLNGSTVRPRLSYHSVTCEKKLVGIKTHSPNLQIRSRGTELHSCTLTNLLTLTLCLLFWECSPFAFSRHFPNLIIHHSHAPLTSSSAMGLATHFCNALQKPLYFSTLGSHSASCGLPVRCTPQYMSWPTFNFTQISEQVCTQPAPHQPSAQKEPWLSQGKVLPWSHMDHREHWSRSICFGGAPKIWSLFLQLTEHIKSYMHGNSFWKLLTWEMHQKSPPSAGFWHLTSASWAHRMQNSTPDVAMRDSQHWRCNIGEFAQLWNFPFCQRADGKRCILMRLRLKFQRYFSGQQ